MARHTRHRLPGADLDRAQARHRCPGGSPLGTLRPARRRLPRGRHPAPAACPPRAGSGRDRLHAGGTGKRPARARRHGRGQRACRAAAAAASASLCPRAAQGDAGGGGPALARRPRQRGPAVPPCAPPIAKRLRSYGLARRRECRRSATHGGGPRRRPFRRGGGHAQSAGLPHAGTRPLARAAGRGGGAGPRTLHPGGLGPALRAAGREHREAGSEAAARPTGTRRQPWRDPAPATEAPPPRRPRARPHP